MHDGNVSPPRRSHGFATKYSISANHRGSEKEGVLVTVTHLRNLDQAERRIVRRDTLAEVLNPPEEKTLLATPEVAREGRAMIRALAFLAELALWTIVILIAAVVLISDFGL